MSVLVLLYWLAITVFPTEVTAPTVKEAGSVLSMVTSKSVVPVYELPARSVPATVEVAVPSRPAGMTQS